MRSAIATDRLSKRYDRIAAVDGLSFEVPEGALVGFVGPNGSGKSTTIRMLTLVGTLAFAAIGTATATAMFARRDATA